MGLLNTKEIESISFCRLITMHERDRQTDHGTLTSSAIGEIALSVM